LSFLHRPHFVEQVIRHVVTTVTDQQSNQVQRDSESASQQALALLMLSRMADDLGRE
jgi:hypothetical protein